MAQQITDSIYWLGVDAPESKSFHGIESPFGGSYNSYLILDEYPTIVDTTNVPFLERYLESLRSVIDPHSIKYIVINHVEPDHTGAFDRICTQCPQATIVCTQKSKEFLEAMFTFENKVLIIETETELSLGKETLRFLPDPMVHWPETMMTYAKDAQALFSGDLFGTEIAHGGSSYDQLRTQHGLSEEAFSAMTKDYYALIMRPYFRAVGKAIDAVDTLTLSSLFPAHGPYYTKNISSIIDEYRRLTHTPEENKICIIYASIWHTTEQMAYKLSSEFEKQGVKTVVYDLQTTGMVRLMREALTSKGLALGSLTMMGSVHPLYETLFRFLELNNQKKKPALVFGSHGWVSAAVSYLKKRLEGLGYDCRITIDTRFRLHPDSEEKIRSSAVSFLEQINES